MFAPVISEPETYEELIKYTDDRLQYNSDYNSAVYSSFYEPQIFIGKIAFFNFTIEICYKTCSECNNILGNKNNHYCIECSNEYPYKYLNGEKCVNSCKDNGLFEYKNECLNKCNENIYVDELSFICYDNCRDNDNISRIITYNNTCVDKCPYEYILNEETNICDKIIIEVYTTNILEEISTLMEIDILRLNILKSFYYKKMMVKNQIKKL